MSDVRRILLDAMMASRQPIAGDSKHQAMVEQIARQVNGRIVDEFLAVLGQAGLRIVESDPIQEAKDAEAWLLDEPCTAETCRHRDHYELRA